MSIFCMGNKSLPQQSVCSKRRTVEIRVRDWDELAKLGRFVRGTGESIDTNPQGY